MKLNVKLTIVGVDMFMQYNITSKENELNKDLGVGRIIMTATFRDSEVDVTRPSFIIKTNELTGNYIYISELNRYYFIDSITSIDNTHSLIQCRCDVLMSHKTEILEAVVKCVQSTNSSSYYYNTDSECRTSTRRFTFSAASNLFSASGMLVLVTSEG